jgi:hypothetical protein
MPSGPKKPDGSAAVPPAVRLSDCPNCGRKEVTVFPVVRPDKPEDTPRLVCPHCCPRSPGDS